MKGKTNAYALYWYFFKYGNGTVTNYKYDDRRRMKNLHHQFDDFWADRTYEYDVLSNITGISVATPPDNPMNGKLGGPVNHVYKYDDYNRLMSATGHYVGADDSAPNMLKQAYSLDMTYDDAHNILEKHQVHQVGSVGSIGQNLPQNAAHAPLTSYKLEYGDYATGQHTADFQRYVQPHAPRTIIEYPNENFNGDPDDPRIKHKTIDYDADGNQLEIKQQIKDPENTQGFSLLSLRKNLWDEEDRLRAVDLAPENDEDKPLVAVYTYDAGGERSIKYVPGRLDARYSAKEAGKADRLESMLYPNPLLSAKTLPIPEMSNVKDPKLISYTKHYYIGSERIASVIGSKRGLGAYDWEEGTISLSLVEDIVDVASRSVQGAVAHFGKTITLPQPFRFSSGLYNGSDIQDPENYAPFWYHPDHLGSSSYITNLAGEINQHMEYLPFGETLIEEHLNSNNSPYKFNAKELDAETGNYYYGARYYDPKWSIWLSVDPLAEDYPDWNPFAYTFQNPINFIDPTGMEGESIGVRNLGEGKYEVVSGKVDGDKGIYLVDDEGNYNIETSEKIVNSITTHSFFDANEEVVGGAVIDMNSNKGQEFVDQVIEDNPSLLGYMWNARNNKKYDFKAIGIEEREENLSEIQHHYRGSVNSNGEVGSGRDYGNITAGMVAARKGLSWQQARMGFDFYQGYSSNGITLMPTPGSIKGTGGIPMPTVIPQREATTSIKAQMTGYLRGLQRFRK